jgi:hypothetical protein
MRMQVSRAALLCLGAAVLSAAPVTSAEAQYYYRRAHPGHAVAGGIAGGLLGGLAAGAIISATRAPVYAAPGPVYVDEPPVYAAPEPVYVPTCHIVRRKVWIDDYAWTFRRERVCE